MKKNQDYIEARNMLIPLAEAFANKKHGTSPSLGEIREDWVRNWNKAFLGRMDSLAKEQGVVKG